MLLTDCLTAQTLTYCSVTYRPSYCTVLLTDRLTAKTVLLTQTVLLHRLYYLLHSVTYRPSYCTELLTARCYLQTALLHRLLLTDRLTAQTVLLTDCLTAQTVFVHRPSYCTDCVTYCTELLNLEPLQFVGNRLDIQGIRFLCLPERKDFSKASVLTQGPGTHPAFCPCPVGARV
jgi:hypothetical protein